MTAFRYDNGVSLGHVLTVLAVLVPAVVLYGVRTDSNQEALKAVQRGLQDTKLELSAKITDARSEVALQISSAQARNDQQFLTVRNDIASLPDVRASLAADERRLNEADSRAEAQSKRAEIVDRMAIETRAKLDGLASDVQRLGAVIGKMQEGRR